MHQKSLLLALSSILLATSAGAQQATLKGIEVGDINKSVAPCDNIFDWSNGAWRSQNRIPASMDRWSRRWQAGERNKDQLKDILDDLSAKKDNPAGSPAQLTGDFYASCANVKAVDAAGLKPLQPLLAQIDSIHDSASLNAVITSMQALGISAPFAFYDSQDPHDPANVIADIAAAGLGLPDRDYYLSTDAKLAATRQAYQAYVARLLTLAGRPDADAAAARVADANAQAQQAQQDAADAQNEAQQRVADANSRADNASAAAQASAASAAAAQENLDAMRNQPPTVVTTTTEKTTHATAPRRVVKVVRRPAGTAVAERTTTTVSTGSPQ